MSGGAVDDEECNADNADASTVEASTGGTDSADTDIRIRAGREGDLLAVLRILEGAMLEVGATQIRARTESEEVLVAEGDGSVVGALVHDSDHVEAVAVTPDRRGTGVGSRLIEAVLDRRGRVTAEFREEVRPFYESLGFEIEEREERLWGERER